MLWRSREGGVEVLSVTEGILSGMSICWFRIFWFTVHHFIIRTLFDYHSACLVAAPASDATCRPEERFSIVDIFFSPRLPLAAYDRCARTEEELTVVAL